MGRQVHQQPHQQRHQHCRQQHSQQQQPTPVGKWKTWMALWHLNVSVSLWQHALFGAHLVSYLFKSFMMGFPLGASPKQKQWLVDASPTIQARPTLIVRFFMFQSLLALPFEEAGRLFNMYTIFFTTRLRLEIQRFVEFMVTMSTCNFSTVNFG